MFAIIDVGSNSVRLMLHDGVKTLSKKVQTTRLAEGIAKTNMLTPEAVERTARAVSFFISEAKSLGIKNPLVFATAAVRQANNGKDFTDKVFDLTGIKVDVVSGELEAMLGINGALDGGDGGVIDIGGASTEIIVKEKSEVVYSKSIKLGAVRAKDATGQDKDSAVEFISSKINEFSSIPTNTTYYAIGGTATTIASMLQELEPYDPTKTDGYKIYKNDVKYLLEKLFSMNVSERAKLKGLQPGREEIIAHGVTILYEIMDKFSIDYVITSEKDNLEGYLYYKKVSL